MKGKVVGCLSIVALATAAFVAVGAIVAVCGLKELNDILDGDTF